jgi:segregation and condensation protein A
MATAGDAMDDITNASPRSIRVGNAPYTNLPQDLYIPPEALEVFLDAFEGPLDLLLYLIKKQNLNVVDIPIAEITRQYMEYVALMQEMRFDLAAEYMVMASTLAEIKSRLLLPRPSIEDEGGEDDPRAELVRRLQEYERYKQAAADLDELPRSGRDFFVASAESCQREIKRVYPEVQLQDLLAAMGEALQRAEYFDHHQVEREILSVRERMGQLLERLTGDRFTPFGDLFVKREGSLGVVVTFLAVLELVRESLLDLVQAEPYAPIHVRLRT